MRQDLGSRRLAWTRRGLSSDVLFRHFHLRKTSTLFMPSTRPNQKTDLHPKFRRALLAFGVALAWLFGREFADATVSGLFAIPISRPTIAIAKLCVYYCWVVLVAIALGAVTSMVGLFFQLG